MTTKQKIAEARRNMKMIPKTGVTFTYDAGTIWAEARSLQFPLVYCPDEFEARQILRTLKLEVK